jgi:hypothetical protein
MLAELARVACGTRGPEGSRKALEVWMWCAKWRSARVLRRSPMALEYRSSNVTERKAEEGRVLTNSTIAKSALLFFTRSVSFLKRFYLSPLSLKSEAHLLSPPLKLAKHGL